jgi:O-antigen/teichoic acid export membrane protein
MTIAARGVVIRTIGFLGSLVLARLLAPDDFGMLAIGLSLTTFATLAADAGLGAALIRRAEAPEKEELRAVAGFQLLVATVLAVVFGVAASFTGVTTVHVAAVMMASVPFYVLRTAGAVEFERLLAYRPLAAIEIVETLAFQAFAIGTVLAGAGVWGVAAASIVRALTGTLLIGQRSSVGITRPRWSWPSVRPLLRFGRDLQGGIAVTLARDNLFNLIVTSIAGLSVLGFWSLAYRLLQPITLTFDAISRVAFSALSRFVETDQRGDPAPIRNAVRIIAIASAFMLSLLVAAAPNSVGLVFGERWYPVTRVLPLLCLGVYLSSPVLITAGNYMYALGRSRAVLVMVSASALVSLGGTAAGFELFGLEGLGLGLVFGGLVEIALLGAYLDPNRRAALLWPLLGPLVAGGVAAALGLYVAGRTGEDVVGVLLPPLLTGLAYVSLASVLARAATRTTVVTLRSSFRGTAS